MKKECIFKCRTFSEWWYVYEMDFGTFGKRFRVYRGRKWYAHTDFELQQYAICAVINAVTVGMSGCSFKVEARS